MEVRKETHQTLDPGKPQEPKDTIKRPRVTEAYRKEDSIDWREDLKTVDDLPDDAVRKALINIGIKQLKALQNNVYQDIVNTNNSLTISSPTESGKTGVMIMAVAVMLNRCASKKIIYLAPTKALCSEQCKTLKQAFPNYLVCEFTGESRLSVEKIKATNIFVMTVEKFDVEQRKKNDSLLFSNIQLIIIDEIHKFKPSLEYILSSLSLLKTEQKADCRVLSFCATIPHPNLLSNFLHSRYIHFRNNYRDTPLKIKVTGFNFTEGVKECDKFEELVELVCREAIHYLNDGALVIIFVPSTSLAKKVAKYLHDIAPGRNKDILSTDDERTILEKLYYLHTGFYHGKQEQWMKERTLNYFGDSINVLVSTEALPAGVNIAADYVVVLETTSVRKYGLETPMSVVTCEQMIGCAGRTGKCSNKIAPGATIITDSENMEMYLKEIKMASPLQSTISLEEGLFREMLIGNIQNVNQCELFIRSTYLYQSQSCEDQETVLSKTESLVQNLKEQNLIKIDKGIQIFNRDPEKKRRTEEQPAKIIVQELAKTYANDLNTYDMTSKAFNELLSIEEITPKNVIKLIAKCRQFPHILLPRKNQRDIIELCKSHQIDYDAKEQSPSQTQLVALFLFGYLTNDVNILSMYTQYTEILKKELQNVCNNLIKKTMETSSKQISTKKAQLLDCILEIKSGRVDQNNVDTKLAVQEMGKIGPQHWKLNLTTAYQRRSNHENDFCTWLVSKTTGNVLGEMMGDWRARYIVLQQYPISKDYPQTNKLTEEYSMVIWDGCYRYENNISVPFTASVTNASTEETLHQNKVLKAFEPEKTNRPIIQKYILHALMYDNSHRIMISAPEGQGESNALAEWFSVSKMNGNKLRVLYVNGWIGALERQSREFASRGINVSRYNNQNEDIPANTATLLTPTQLLWKLQTNNIYLAIFDVVIVQNLEYIFFEYGDSMVALSIIIEHLSGKIKKLLLLAELMSYTYEIGNTLGVANKDIHVLCRRNKNVNFRVHTYRNETELFYNIVENAKENKMTLVLCTYPPQMAIQLREASKTLQVNVVITTVENSIQCSEDPAINKIFVLQYDNAFNWDVQVKQVILCQDVFTINQHIIKRAVSLGKLTYLYTKQKEQVQYYKQLNYLPLCMSAPNMVSVLSLVRSIISNAEACIEALDSSWILKYLDVNNKSEQYKEWKNFVKNRNS